MKHVLQHKGYLGSIEADVEGRCLYGTVQGVRDTIHYEGRTIDELSQAFQDSVEDYLAMCAEENEQPEKPFSGRFMARVGENLHRRAAALAAAEGVSLNVLMVRALQREVVLDTKE